jgi:hypothetical protein
MAQDQTFNLDTLLDGTLDDIADLPEFRPYPTGAHKVSFKIEQNAKDLEAKKLSIYYVQMVAIETLELSNPEETPLTAGSRASTRYDLSNQYGQGAFKKILASIATVYPGKSNRELIAVCAESQEAVVITKITTNKDKTQSYTDIVELTLV